MIDYEVMYQDLYDGVARMLVSNRDEPMTPKELLKAWDNLRESYDRAVG
tara:strand:+ start:1091 stop:1237 length:147 start_codon:yes stop_codon:yes gene_type:complete